MGTSEEMQRQMSSMHNGKEEYGANNKLVSTERYNELKEKMRKKLQELAKNSNSETDWTPDEK